ncbi:unnamed protein product, partial [Closterium sp. NIES-53]
MTSPNNRIDDAAPCTGEHQTSEQLQSTASADGDDFRAAGYPSEFSFRHWADGHSIDGVASMPGRQRETDRFEVTEEWCGFESEETEKVSVLQPVCLSYGGKDSRVSLETRQETAAGLLETPMLQGAGGGDGWMDSRMSSRGGGCGVGGSEEEGRRGGERGREVGEKVEIGRKEENEERETEEKEEEKEKKQEAWSSYETVFTNAKAGMEGVDKERVKRIVYAMSQGSRFFQHEQRKEAVLLAKIAHMQRAKQAIPPEKLALLERQADGMLARMVSEASREGRRVWVHVDMDAFYAAVEALGDARLRDVPMAVGGMGMLCTANYEARKYGVRAAMPGFIARKLCPELVFVPPDFTKYQHYSNLTHEVFRQYDPHFVARSLDEAYLDITAVCKERSMTPAQVAEELRHKVHAHTGLTCSAGVAANRMLAKVCSDINKPNGQYVLPFDREAILSFISSLPIRKIGGVGKVTERLLRDVLGVTVCADIITHRGALLALFSPISAEFFLQAALGIGGSGDVEEGPRKSISCERTFSPLSAEPAILNKLEELSFALAKDLEEHGMKGRTLTLKLKTTAFEVRTRAVSVPEPIGSQQEIWPLVVRLIRAELPVSVRLLGLRMSALVPRASSGSSRQATISEVLGGRRGGGDSAKGVAEGKYPTGSPEWKFPTGPTEGKQSAYMGVKRVAPSKSRGGEERERLLEENLVEGWREAHGGAKGVEERQLGSCFELTQNRERLVVESLVEGGREAHGGAKGVEERRFEAPHNILEGEREVHGGVEGVEERRLGGEGREHARLFNACVQNETGREVGEGEVRGCGDGGAELSGCEWEGGWDSESEWEECGEGMAGVMDGWRSGGGERQEREEKEEREEREKREEGEGREEKQEKEERKGEEREEREEEEEKQEREESEKREGREEREEREGRMKCIDVEKACAQVGRRRMEERRMEERRMEEREGEEEEVKEKEVTLALTQKAFQMPHMSFEDATHNQEGMEKQEMVCFGDEAAAAEEVDEAKAEPAGALATGAMSQAFETSDRMKRLLGKRVQGSRVQGSRVQGSRVEKGGKAGRARKKRQLEKQQQQQLCIDSLLQHVAAGGTRGAGAC